MKHLLVILFCFVNFFTQAQEKYIPLRITKDITLDGQLKEGAWQQTPVVSAFMQDDPVPGNAPSELTECRFLYNDMYLYLGVKVFDSEPSKIIANSMERDFEIGRDDGVALILDTYHDKRTGLLFVGTPLGARYDEEINEDGNYENPAFNTFWDLGAHFDSTGYEMEFRIPFSSLRFKQSDTVIMGFKFVRNVMRRNEYDLYPKNDPAINNAWNKVSLGEEIVFTNLKSKKPFYFAPYVIGNYSEKNELNKAGTTYENSTEWLTRKHYSSNKTVDKIISNIGADAKYGISKNFTLDLTLNTDFAQVEADDYIVNLTRFDVNLPEKRNFFLESQNYLEFPINNFYSIFNSRDIGIEGDQMVPIIGGARLTGKANGWSVGVMELQTKGVDSFDIPSNNFSVLRVRKDIGTKGSYIGGVLTNKISASGHSISNHVAGLDYFHRVNQVWYGRAQIAVSKDAGEKLSAGNFEGNFYVAQDKRVGFANTLYVEVFGGQFNPGMGFLPENNYWNISLHNSYIWDLNKHGQLNYLTLSNTLSSKWFLKQGTGETFTENPSLALLFKKGRSINLSPAYIRDHVTETWHLSDEITIPVGTYKMFTPEIIFNGNANHTYTFNGDVKFGDFYGGKMILINPSCHIIFNKYFFLDLNYQFTNIKFPAAYNERGKPVYISHLVNGKFALIPSTKFSIKVLAQYDYQSSQFGGNLRLRYNPREGTDLYFVVNENLNTNVNDSHLSPQPPVLDNQSVIVKFVKTFSL